MQVDACLAQLLIRALAYYWVEIDNLKWAKLTSNYYTHIIIYTHQLGVILLVYCNHSLLPSEWAD